MPVNELIDLAIALPKEDQIRLINAVQEDRCAKLEREFAAMIRPGFVAEFWLVDTPADGIQLIQDELETLQRGRQI